MKFTIDGAAFRAAVGRAELAVEGRNTIPILGFLRLAATADGTLRLTGSNLDVWVETQGPLAACDRAGECCLPARALKDIAGTLPDGAQVELSLSDGGRATIRAGRSRWVLNSLPVEDFPAVPDVAGADAVTLPAAALESLFGRTLFAASDEQTRYYLCGIYLHGAGDRLIAVATNGHILARAEADRGPPPSVGKGGGVAREPDIKGVIVPSATAQMALKLAKEGDAPVGIDITNSRIRFAVGATALTSKLVDGTFPDYDRVIPRADEGHALEVATAELRASLRRVQLVSVRAKDGTRAVALTCQPDGGLTVEASSQEGGEAADEIEAVWAGRAAMRVGANALYLAAVAEACGAERMTIRVSDPSAPMRVEGADGWVGVVMPMRV